MLGSADVPLAEITCPVQIITGENDAVVVLYSEEPEHIGCNGSMIGVDGPDAIVKLDGGEDIVIVELGHLGKVIAR